MRGTHVARLRAAAAQLVAKYSSSTSPPPLTIAAEVAEAFSSRSSRLTQLPPDVAAAIDAAATDANRKAIRSKGRELTDELKRISRTKHRGGKYPNLHDAPPEYSIVRTLRGKRRQKENKALTELAQQHTPLAVDEHEPLPDSFWDGQERGVTNLLNAITSEAKEGATATAAAGGAMYQEDTAAAYAVTRFPACYAAIHRVLHEVQRTAPRGWTPESVLDFGAGPGTATWAVHSIWSSVREENNQGPVQVTAVEPSGAMAWLGQDIQQRLEDAYQKQEEERGGGFGNFEKKKAEVEEDNSSTLPKLAKLPQPPMVRWMFHLSGSRGKRNSKEKRTASYFSSKKYDIVIAGYVLSEVPTAKERRRLVADLWNRTGKYLILVEPGTPVGSDMIHAARSQILDLTSSSSSFTEAAGAAATAASEAAHVVAPCPHDGPCPLKNQGRASWCHFIQRFERTAVQRRVKMVPGKVPPRNHQDERFSYIVLKRGLRNGTEKEESVVVEDYQDDEDDVFDVLHDMYKDVHNHDVFNRHRQVHVSGSFEKEEEVDNNSEFLSIPENLKPKRILLQNNGGSLDSDEEEEEEEDEEEDGDDDDLEATERELRRLLLDSLETEYSDEYDSDGSITSSREIIPNELPSDLEEVLQRSLAELRENNRKKNMMEGTSEERGHDGDIEEETEDAEEVEEYLDNDDEFQLPSIGFGAAAGSENKKVVVKGVSGPEAEEAARISSTIWSRIIRPPRKRSGHVVIDICSAVGTDGEQVLDDSETSDGDGSWSGSRPIGVLLRQIVSKGKAKREIGGIAPFKLARRAAWGDLWPLDYQRNMKSFEPPGGSVAGGVGGGGDSDGTETDS
jgi:ribosomal protein RSM22 (predicted rRNA methylase)